MGVKCCKETHHDQLFETDGKPIMTQYQESAWPGNDQYLIKQLQNSKIIGSDQGIRPLKHKAYDQWFWGDWTNGRPIGKGILYSQNGNKKIFYEGDFNGEPNGKGRVIYNEGEYQYQGDVENSRATGFGRLKNFKQNYEYDGYWKDSRMTKGKLIIRGDRQNGLFRHLPGYKNPHGDIEVDLDEDQKENRIKYPDGRVYVGEIDKDSFGPQGKGKVTFSDGSFYQGDWKDNQMDGEGIFKWKDGSEYIGQYRHGKKHGKGNFIFPNGNHYQGFWHKGKQHGRGILFSKEGVELQSGEWNNGNFIGEKKKSLLF